MSTFFNYGLKSVILAILEHLYITHLIKAHDTQYMSKGQSLHSPYIRDAEVGSMNFNKMYLKRGFNGQLHYKITAQSLLYLLLCLKGGKLYIQRRQTLYPWRNPRLSSPSHFLDKWDCLVSWHNVVEIFRFYDQSVA
jgi:hypothetical protein